MDEKFIINIGRQFGSGGHDISKRLSELLKVPFYDKELINLASKESGLDERFFEETDEKVRFSFFENFLGLEYSKNFLGGDSLFQIQSDIIRKLSKERSCVFVGRCSDYILRDYPNSLSIFICADEEDRINRTAEKNNISLQKAKELNEKIDKKRKEYYNFYSDKYWGRASSYDLCINSSILGLKETTNFILQFVKLKLKIKD